MTTALVDDWTEITAIRDELYGHSDREVVDGAYVISDTVDGSRVINGATLDPKGHQVNRPLVDPTAITVTIAHELVHQHFTEPNPLDVLVVGPWMNVAAERLGQANTSLFGSRMRRILGPIPPQYPVDVGITCLSGLKESTGRIPILTYRLYRALHDERQLRSARPQPSTAPATPRVAAPTDSQANANWLKTNSSKFVGQWIALKEGRLLAADPSRANLARRLRADDQLAGAFLVSLKN